MSDFQVTCIVKRGDHYDPHARIQAIGGGDTLLGSWRHTEDQAIANIDAKTHRYFVSVGGHSVLVVVAKHNGRKYLKTEPDGYKPDNLLSLKNCG